MGRVSPWVAGFVALDRGAVSSACFALYLSSSLLLRSFSSPWLGLGWTALAVGFWLAPKKSIGPRPLFVVLVVLLLTHAMAILGSLTWGDGNWESTTGVLLWMAPALLLYIAASPTVLRWLTPVFLIHGGLVIFQGITAWRWVQDCIPTIDPGKASWTQYCKPLDSGAFVFTGSPTGLANNPNLAAGLLVLGMVYFLNRRDRLGGLAGVLMVTATLATNSRWGIAVGLALLLAMVLSRRVPARVLGLIVGCLAGLFVLLALATPVGFRVAGYNSLAGVVAPVSHDVLVRLQVPHIPSFLPRGVAEHPGLHNVPLRIAIENGVQAAALWIGITLWALWRRRNGTAWWMLLALAILSMLDYYTWMGHLGGFWWLLVGLLVKRRAPPLETQ